MLTNIKLSETTKEKKFKLASAAGYKIVEEKITHKCHIIGADNYIDNDFRNIDDVLKYIAQELSRKGFCIAA